MRPNSSTWLRRPPRSTTGPPRSAIRAATASASTMPEAGVPLEIGRGRVIKQGNTVALLSLGTRLAECMKAAEMLAAHGISTTVADARFAKPLDRRSHPAAWHASMNCSSRSRKARLADSARMSCRFSADAGALDRRASRSAAWCCRMSSSTTTPRPRCTPRPGSMRTASSRKCSTFSDRVRRRNCSRPRSPSSPIARNGAAQRRR